MKSHTYGGGGMGGCGGSPGPGGGERGGGGGTKGCGGGGYGDGGGGGNGNSTPMHGTLQTIMALERCLLRGQHQQPGRLWSCPSSGLFTQQAEPMDALALGIRTRGLLVEKFSGRVVCEGSGCGVRAAQTEGESARRVGWCRAHKTVQRRFTNG